MNQSTIIASVILMAMTACGERSADSDAATAALSGVSSASPQGEMQEIHRSNVQRFQETTIKDEGRGGMAAYSIFVPAGWDAEGGFQPVPGYPMLPYLGEYKVSAPDGRFASFTPFAEFGFSDYAQAQPFQPFQGRPWFRQPPSLGDFTVAVAQLTPSAPITNIQIVSEEVLEDATAYVRNNARSSYKGAQDYTAQYGYSGERYNYDIHVRKLVMKYDEGGRRMESTTFATIASNIIQFADGSVKSAMWSITNAYSVGAEDGIDYAADPTLAAIVRSNRINPQWAQAVALWYQNNGKRMVAEARAAAAAQSRATTRIQQSEDVLDISFNGWKNRNAITDAGQSSLVNSIHEQTTYATPGGGSVNLPSFYRNAYTDGQGNYVLTDDVNYNLNTDPAFNSRDWRQIDPVQ